MKQYSSATDACQFRDKTICNNSYGFQPEKHIRMYILISMRIALAAISLIEAGCLTAQVTVYACSTITLAGVLATHSSSVKNISKTRKLRDV